MKLIPSRIVLLIALLCPIAASAQRTPTPAQTEGPYYPVTLPAETDPDLTRIGNGPLARGDIVVFAGQVLDPAGQPFSNALVEIWQTDHRGIYMHPRADRTADRDRNFQFYGRMLTGADGSFRFRTIIPAPYPGRPRHIHAKITPQAGRTLTTQFYFKGDRELAGDGISRRLGAALETVLLDPAPAADGVRSATATIIVPR